MKKLVVLSFALFASSAWATGPIVAGSTLTLRDCINIAVANDPDIKYYDYTAKAQREVQTQVTSGYLPTVTANAGYITNKSNQLNAADARTTVGDFDSKAAGVTVNQLLLDFGKTPLSIKASKANVRAAEYSREDQAVQVVQAVKKAYYALLFSQRALVLSDEIVQQYRKNLAYATAHYEAKIKPRYDVTKAEADLSGQMLDYIKNKNAVILSREYLINTMNLIGAPAFFISDDMDFSKYKADFDALLTQAYANRQDLLSLQAQYESLQATVRSSKMDRMPNLSATAGYNFSGTQSPISRGWNAGLQLSMDLFTGMRKFSKVSEQENRLQAMKYKIESAKLAIYLNLKEQYLDLTKAEQEMETAQDQVREATENLDIANTRYQTGLSAPVEISDATVTYNNAKLSLLQSLYDYKIAQTNIERATGNKQ